MTAAADTAPALKPARQVRGRLFRKYVGLFVAVVCLALFANGLFEIWFSYQEHKAALIRIQREQAEAAAAKIGQFVKEIEGQLGWTVQLPWSASTLEQRRFDALRLLRQVPAITELSQLDSTGKEQLRVSRLAMDVVGSGTDFSKDPKFVETAARKVYYGPVYFRRESEPYMTLAVAGTRRDAGVSVAEVNLKLIWDVISQIKVGRQGHAYVVGPQGRLIAHPDISLVLRNTDMSGLPQVQAASNAAEGDELQEARDTQGRKVLTAHARVAPLRWFVFVELPVEEAYAPLYDSIRRSAFLLLGALLLAALAGTFLARRMMVPIQALRAGAERIGRGELSQRIAVKTGDELEALADQFNDMAGRLEESYAGLERKVEERTRELTKALETQQATGEILASISASITDAKPVFEAIVRNLSRLFGTRFAVVQVLRDGMIEMPAVQGQPGFEKLIERYPRPLDETTAGGRAMLSKRTLQYSPVLGDPAAPPSTQDFARDFGFNSVIFTPMMREDRVIGAIGAAHHETREFDEQQVALIRAFADQAVIAIENVRLFDEVQARTRELQEALEQQTATADILAAISSSQAQLKPVFETIVDRTTRLCEASFACVALFEGEALRFAAISGASADTEFFRPERLHQPDGCPYVLPLAHARNTVQTPDLRAEKGYLENDPFYVTAVDVGGARTALRVPLLKDGAVLGHVWAFRQEVRPFSDTQVELIGNFAKQAVIAIENARLFEAEQARTRELQESLEYQTATSEVLGVISRAPNELQPVFEAIVDTAARLCEAEHAFVFQRDGEVYRLAANHGFSEEYVQFILDHPIPPGRATLVGRTALTAAIVHFPDCLADPEYKWVESQKRGGFRTMLGVPLLRDGAAVGVIALTRTHVRPFSQKQIELVETFADQAVIAIENVRLFEEVQARTAELQESLEYQTATSDVLNVISRSPSEIQPVLDTIVETAARLCDASDAIIALREGDWLKTAAHRGPIPVAFGAQLDRFPIGRGWVTGRAVVDRKSVHIPDLQAAADEFPDGQTMALRMGHRTIVATPLMREDAAIGALVIRRTEVRPFSEKQIALLQTFADQAVIAISNVRLFEEVQARTRELQESLEYQTATSEVLNVMSRSPTDAKPVFDAIVTSAAELCGAVFSNVQLFDGEMLHVAATHNFTPEVLEQFHKMYPRRPDRLQISGRAILSRTTVHVHDVLEDAEYPRELALAGNWRAILSVPMLRDGTAVGVITVSKSEPVPFSGRQIELLNTFADQAVIAIGNVRLFEEVQARTAELQESLEYQTATSDVLNVISRSPSDLQPVLDTIVETAGRLCDAYDTTIFLRAGDRLDVAAHRGAISNVSHRPPIGRGWVTGRAVVDRKPVHVPDLLAAADEFPDAQTMARRMGHRTILAMPLVRDDVAIGAILLRRTEIRPFSDKQVAVLQTFADQAVIAIENVRLFEEVQARTAELTEALEQQTATSEVLQAISRSTFDLDAVLETLVQSAARLCEADISTITRQKDGVYYRGALHGFPPDFAERIRSVPVELTRGNVTGRALLEGAVVHIEDVKTDPEYTWVEAQEAGQFRTVLGVPLLRQGTPIGAMALARRAMRPFTERQIELVKTFADQAVIAIENARLFEEVQARTAELARSVGELQALGEVSQAVNSTLDLQTVLDTIVAKAVQLSGTDAGAIYVFSKLRQKFRLRSTYGMSAELIDAIGRQHIHIGESYIGRAAQQREPVQVADLRDEPPSPVQDIVLKAGYRALLVVPLLRPGRVVGALVVRRRTPGEFPRPTLELLQTFAAQSVLAIQNARLFSEIEEKSREIEIASRHKSQFLANMSHELRTPMNAVLGFTEMMADGLYGQLPEKALKALERVQANGKHLLGLINDVLDLSKIEAGQLTLALDDYSVGQVVQTVLSGTESLAKAKGLALTASVAEGLPLGRGDERRLTQVLLNLVGNAIKFTDRGSVEIRAGAVDGFFDVRVRDTGPGIAPEDQKRIFEEFQQVDSSSTRQKGGTGLGLAISKRIVEMHGGTLTVDSVLGEGSTFKIVMPVRAEERKEAAE